MKKLTKQEKRLLRKLTEECGEAVQQCMKTLQHGNDRLNSRLLHEEVGDIETCIEVLTDLGVLSREKLNARKALKLPRILEQIGA